MSGLASKGRRVQSAATAKKVRRRGVSLKKGVAMTVHRSLVTNEEKLVYVHLASKKQSYEHGTKSRIVYIGTTKTGKDRVASSIAERAPRILKLHGVKTFDVRIITCKGLQKVRSWKQLETALLIAFRSMYGTIPRCNKQGKNIDQDNECWKYFAKAKIDRVIKELDR